MGIAYNTVSYESNINMDGGTVLLIHKTSSKHSHAYLNLPKAENVQWLEGKFLQGNANQDKLFLKIMRVKPSYAQIINS